MAERTRAEFRWQDTRRTLRGTGAHVWRWVGRGAVGGHVHLAMAPLWFAAALALEPLHDLLMRATVP